MSKTVLKNTNTLSVVKCSATTAAAAINETVGLATDILATTQTASTPNVAIAFVQWACSPGAADAITITRGGTVVLTLYQNGELDFGGNGGFLETTGAASDIVVTSTAGSTCQVYLTLRKVAGYANKLEPEFFGPYDNTTLVGS